MSEISILSGYVRIAGSNLYSEQEVEGKKVPLLWSTNSVYVGATVMRRDSPIRLSVRSGELRLIIEGFLGFIRSKPTERDKITYTIAKLQSDTEGKDKEIILGFDPEKGYWLCLREVGADPASNLQYLLRSGTWLSVSGSGGSIMPIVNQSSLFAISYFEGLRDVTSHILAEFYTSIDESANPRGATPPPGSGATGSEKIDDVPF